MLTIIMAGGAALIFGAVGAVLGVLGTVVFLQNHGILPYYPTGDPDADIEDPELEHDEAGAPKAAG